MRIAALTGVVAGSLAVAAHAEPVPGWAIGTWVGKVSFTEGAKDNPNRVLMINDKGECWFGFSSSRGVAQQPDCVIGKDSVSFGTSAGSSYVLKLNGQKLDGTAQYVKASRSYRISLNKQ